MGFGGDATGDVTMGLRGRMDVDAYKDSDLMKIKEDIIK